VFRAFRVSSLSCFGPFVFRAALCFGPSPDPGRWFRAIPEAKRVCTRFGCARRGGYAFLCALHGGCRAIPIRFVCPCPGRTKACRGTWAALVRNAGGRLSGADAESGPMCGRRHSWEGKYFMYCTRWNRGEEELMKLRWPRNSPISPKPWRSAQRARKSFIRPIALKPWRWMAVQT